MHSAMRCSGNEDEEDEEADDEAAAAAGSAGTLASLAGGAAAAAPPADAADDGCPPAQAPRSVASSCVCAYSAHSARAEVRALLSARTQNR